MLRPRELIRVLLERYAVSPCSGGTSKNLDTADFLSSYVKFSRKQADPG